jgi:predicted dehydrogenase
MEVKGIRLVGAAEVDRQRRAEVAAELRAAIYATADSLLTQSQPQIVALATPPAARAPIVEKIARSASVRALVVETPMANSLADAHRMVDSCEGAGIRLIVAHPLRFCPEFTELKRAVKSGELGRLKSLQGFCFGNLLDQGPHLLDLVCWLADGQRAQSALSQPDATLHQIEFESGLRATLETEPLDPPSDLTVDPQRPVRIVAVGTQGVAEARAGGDLNGSPGDYQVAKAALYDELRDALLSGGGHRNDWHDALRSFELLAACGQSAVEGTMTSWPLNPDRDALARLGSHFQRGVSPGSVAEVVRTRLIPSQWRAPNPRPV